MVLDKIALYAMGVALAASIAFGGYAWFVHGHAMFVEGRAVESAHWQDVIRKANQSIDRINGEADLARAERDRAVNDLKDAADKIELVPIPFAVSSQCDLPDDARRALNAINTKKVKP